MRAVGEIGMAFENSGDISGRKIAFEPKPAAPVRLDLTVRTRRRRPDAERFS